MQLRKSEIISSLSFALDLTEGQPLGHSVNSCLLGMRIAELIGIPQSELADLYYAMLTKDLGCSSNAARMFEVFGGESVLGTGPYADVDPETARSVLAEIDRLAREDLAPSYVSADRNPPVFDPATHTAPMPADFLRTYQAFMDAGFWRLDLPAELGGTDAPRMLWWSLAELVLGANHAVAGGS